ncbi:guanylate-binding protein 1-like [Clupea harengus]|uniref:Guanylate-binding protein 1-like n=1 Tax=Clupea harengus TaxID=7950 RepID=A0A8M1KCD4_CLUHA|nr:guanylate-binding protein 1-like [Clupea harengus]
MSEGPPHMPAPVCLIENAEGGLRTVESALDILRGIQQSVVVVAVVGFYRTGKSYLMNRLAGQQSGFALGSPIESKTKGIWMWCVPHPSKPGHTLLLLDTEGLGDEDKGDSKNDAWIFCLGVLLSSTLVYNSRGTIDNQALEKLHYVTELTNQIRIKSSGARDEDGDVKDCEFVRFFPDFVWAVRDFTLERKIDGRSEDEYLDFALQLKKGWSDELVTYNLPRQCIRNFFPTLKCFTFPFPTLAKNMTNLDSMAEADLCPDFLSVANRFCSHVFAESRVKRVQGGHKVTGSRFRHLVKIYVDTINSGSVHCLENAVVAMAEIENQSAVNECFRLYEQGMGDLSKIFPMDVGTVSAEHHRLNAMAIQEFLKRSFKDEGGGYMTQLVEKVSKLYDQLITLNKEASEKLCWKLLLDLYAQMANNIRQGRYAKAGGYEIYCRDRDAMVAEYRQHDKKGMKGEEVLEDFLQEKNVEAKSILRVDEKLTEIITGCPAILQANMSGGPPRMPAPVCLIENAEGELQTVESALDILRGIQQPLVVVAVVGLYRTGKSYLMNRLAGQQSGFALGSTIESKTKGIWMWCVPHPSKPGHTMLMLDTEGLGDVDKGDSNNDAWIFCLAVLLSSTLVYNSRGSIDNQALEKLQLMKVVWQKQTIPTSWRRARGVLIPKEKDAADLSQFRHISLLNVEGKIFFSVVAQAGCDVQLCLTTEEYNTAWQRLDIGIMAGCTISPLAFTMAMEVIIRASRWVVGGQQLKTGLRLPPIRAYMDDMTTLTTTMH